MFNSESLSEIKDDIQNILYNYGINKNIGFSVGRITYSPDTFKLSIEAFSGKENTSIEKSRFLKNKDRVKDPMNLIQDDWFGKTIIMDDGKTKIIYDINPRAKKYPMLLKDRDSGKIDRKTTIAFVYEKLSQMP